MFTHVLFRSWCDAFVNYIIFIIIYVGESITLKSILKVTGDNMSFVVEEILWEACLWQALTLGNMTTGDSVNKSLVCVSEHA